MGIAYATREQVKTSLEITHASYSDSLIDAKIQAASRDDVEGLLKRRFYPERRTTLYDWPQNNGTPTWEIDLGINELISVEAVISGGTNITSDVILRRADNIDEPPYDLLQIDLSSSSAFSSGTTWQQSISVLGLHGYSDTATSIVGSSLSGAINSSVTTVVLIPASGVYTPGVGSLLKMENERLLVMDRRMSAVSGQTISGDVGASKGTTTVGVTSGAAFAAGEVILIDAERMRIDDIAGNNLIVRRSWDGTTLAAHTTGAAVYALRTFTVVRGALGSTAAAHSDAVSVYTHEYPPLVNELCWAQSVVSLEQNSAGYNRTAGAQSPTLVKHTTGQLTQRLSVSIGLDDIRERAWNAYGRNKGRSAAI